MCDIMAPVGRPVCYCLICYATISSSTNCSGLIVSLPSLCCPGHHPEASTAIAPHPDVRLVESAAVSPVLLHVSGGSPKTPITTKEVLNHGVTVLAYERLNDGARLPQGRCRWAAARKQHHMQ